MKYIITVLLCFIQLSLSAQKLSEVQWSNWIAISDRNENKILFSFAYSKFGTRRGIKWYFRIKNDYKEVISGRFIYEYSSTDGGEHTSSYILHCMPGKSIASNDLLFVANVEKLTNIYFVEFNPCSLNSRLTSFTIKDTALLKLQDAMIAQQKSRIQSENTYNVKANSSSEKANDFSDRVISYKGKNEDVIRKLLSSVKGWRTNSGLQIQDGIPPEVPINNNCQRDQYVYSAILYAWAAESYYRINEIEKAEKVSDKIPSLINLVTQLCGGNPNYVDGNCNTVMIFPCEVLDNSSQHSTAANNPQKDNKAQNITESTSPKVDMQKEKELLYSLLPLASTGFNPQNANFTNAFSGFMSKFDSYVEDDSTLGTGVKFFIKLANLNTMSQLRELSGDNISYTNFVQKIGNLNEKVSGNFNKDNALMNSISINKPLSQMSTTEIRAQIEPLWNAIGSLLEPITNEDGLTGKGEKRITERYDEMRQKNKELKSTYGYDMNDFMFSIRNHDDALFDKIISTGFPINLSIGFSDRNESDEQAIDFTTNQYSNKFSPKPIHYAAKYGNTSVIKKLIAKGADIYENGSFTDMQSFDNGDLVDWYTNPLAIAVTFNRYEASSYLLSIMKNPFKTRFKKSMALATARAWKNDEMVDLIQSYSK
ncbi:MAG: ankyrin repeat domain-containing protein [Chitinophagaceae bacterium]|nr:ankyrin repeat domain-containing protein [Chitinophagaceae bacterium]